MHGSVGATMVRRGVYGYRATRPKGPTGVRSTLISVTPLHVESRSLEGAPYPLRPHFLTPSYPQTEPPPHTRRLCPSSGADPRGQVNQRPGLWKHGRSHGRSALIIRVGTRRGVSSQSTQTLYVHQHEQGFLHVFQLAV